MFNKSISESFADDYIKYIKPGFHEFEYHTLENLRY